MHVCMYACMCMCMCMCMCVCVYIYIDKVTMEKVYEELYYPWPPKSRNQGYTPNSEP